MKKSNADICILNLDIYIKWVLTQTVRHINVILYML